MRGFIALIVVSFMVVLTVVDTKKSGKAHLTHYESYPDPNGEECREYNGCTWAGQFKYVNGKKPKSWVKSHNIIAVHEKDGKKYKLKTFKITQGSHSINATVYDVCSDSDCDGCCTKNAEKFDFLIDMEKYTYKRFGGKDGDVRWKCLDC